MIETLISSKTRVKLLVKFFLNSSNTGYLRNLEEEFGESTNAIRLELNKFEKAGFLESYTEGNKKLFTANTHHPLFSDLHSIIMKLVGLDHVIDYVLARIGNLDEVYLVGKMAKGQNTDVIDLIVVGSIDRVFLDELIAKAERKIGKKIKYTHYTSSDFNLKEASEPGIRPLLLWSK